jgi:hypothetical protein
MTLLLYIRWQQLQREISGLGLYLLVYIGLAGYIALAFFKQFQQGQNAIYIVIGITTVCIGLQFYRTDKSFVYKHLNNPHFQIFLEYVVLTFPFSISCIITKSWYYYPGLLILLLCIPFFKFQFEHKAIFKNLSSIIPANNFEWISGLRRNHISFISLYLAAAAFCWVRILPLFLLWLLTITISSFHNECEPIQVLRENNTSPGKYLSGKLRINIIYILVLYTPLIILNSIFNTDFLGINLLFIPMQVSMLCFAICLKYSSYKPNKNQIGNNIPLAIVSLASAVPYLLPVPAILSFIYFYKAGHNLTQYLND